MNIINKLAVIVATCLVYGTFYGVCGSKKQVYFSLIISGGENGFSSSGGIPSIDMALEAVARMEILPGYNLTYNYIQNSKVSINSYMDLLFSPIFSAVH